MRLQIIDWVSVVGFFAVALCIGVAVSRQAGRSSADYFLSGRKMPWWLLGISMVATTFSTDTPNLVTDLTRSGGVGANWVWWAFLLTGMATVFFYARLWRRLGSLTDLEFYELRYSGQSAAVVRGFNTIRDAIRLSGEVVAPGKAGPDYIDPAFHAAASAAACSARPKIPPRSR